MSVHTFELVRNFGNDSKGYRQFKELREFIIADSKKNGYQFPYKERKNPKIPKFKGQGIRVVLHQGEYINSIQFIINLHAAIVANDLVGLITSEAAEEALNIVNWKLVNWLGDDYAIDKLTLSRVDICSNIGMSNEKLVSEYIAQLYRTGTIKSFRIKDSKDYGKRFDSEAGFTTENKHDGSELSVYNKKLQLSKENLDWTGTIDILRTEYRIKNVKHFCRKNSYTCKSNTDTLIWFIWNSESLLADVVSWFIIDADYYKLKEIREIISDSVKSKKLRSRMCRFAELISRHHGMRNARKKLEQEDDKFNSRAYRKMISEFKRIKVNPVPLPEKSKLNTLPSMFEWLE